MESEIKRKLDGLSVIITLYFMLTAAVLTATYGLIRDIKADQNKVCGSK